MGLTLLALICGFVLDLLIGDPHWFYHPIRLVGKLIENTEKILRNHFPKTPKGELAGGIYLFLVVTVVTALVPCIIIAIAAHISIGARFVVEMLFCYFMLATRALKDESMKVHKALEADDLPGAREAVSMIVGRDTNELTEEGVAKATIETVAENASDGVIAPLFYLAIGGIGLGAFYKAVNTMDSMVGYKNEAYEYFGRCAAKMDDVFNFLPARISGLLMVAAAAVCGFDGKNAWKIFKRDRKKHASPNSAQTEAVMAGALDIELAGDAYYFGKLHKKQTIGDPIRPVEFEDIKRANHLLYMTASLALGLFVLLRYEFIIWLGI